MSSARKTNSSSFSTIETEPLFCCWLICLHKIDVIFISQCCGVKNRVFFFPFLLIRVKNSSHDDVSEDEPFGRRKDFFHCFFFFFFFSFCRFFFSFYLILYTLWMVRGTPNIPKEGKRILPLCCITDSMLCMCASK